MATARPILVVVGDASFSQALTKHISIEGIYQPVSASTLADATRCFDADDAQFDLVILAVELPDGDGPNFCARLRDRGYRMPIVLVAKASDIDEARALNAGATDFIAVPYRQTVLLARLRAALRSYDDSVYAVFTIGPWTFSPLHRELTRRDGSRRVLGNKEALLLKYFCHAGDCVISPKSLLSEVWGYHTDVRTHTLQTHIYRLRQNLEVNPKKPLFLVTDPGGYHLNMAGVALQGELHPTRDAEEEPAEDWLMPSIDVRCFG